ncbi:MAG: hypothetical protein KGQ59_03340, partial [Bdellovibrionales bacterium]|nr:hypothetical protein [Bdellovibrionales bacterium]
LVRARKRSTILKKETVSLTDKIRDFKSRLLLGKLTDLAKLMSALPEKNEVVVTFLASLELGRLKKLRLHQNETYAPIYLELLESLENFDERMASGFDSITQAVQAELGLGDAAGAPTPPEPAGDSAVVADNPGTGPSAHGIDLAAFTGIPDAGNDSANKPADELAELAATNTSLELGNGMANSNNHSDSR